MSIKELLHSTGSFPNFLNTNDTNDKKDSNENSAPSDNLIGSMKYSPLQAHSTLIISKVVSINK